jgi:CHASE2 domain-containing sensor protein
MTPNRPEAGTNMQMTDEQILYLANNMSIVSREYFKFGDKRMIAFARALLARQPAAIDKDTRAAVEFYAANPSAALMDFQKRFAAAPSVEQDERGAFIEAYMEARAASVAQAGAVFDNDWPAKQMWSAGIAYARAASTSANVAQGAEAVYQVRNNVRTWIDVDAEDYERCLNNDRRIVYAAPPAQTALTDDVLMQAIADTAARGHVWASRALSNFRAARSASGGA